ncbi:MAG: glycerol acyltransferase [Bacteroidales bacterium]|nr:glycerol acyltransferase [Bacteroidales bacterium]
MEKQEQIVIGKKHIDMERILASKGVKLPKLALRLINKVLNVDEINAGLYALREYDGMDFVHKFLESNDEHCLGITIEVEGGENIPLDGNPIVAGNHPLGGPDGLALIAAVGRYRDDILFPVNDFLLHLPALRKFFVPIDKVHRNSSTASGLEEAFGGQNALLYFPAGACSRRQNGVIKDLDWKPTFVKKAIQYKRNIVPFYFDAHNRNRFYTIANLRKKLGVKFSFEMALLPSEMYAQAGNTFRLVFGQPIPYTVFNDRHSPREWAALLKEHTYALKTNPYATFNY